MRSKTLLLTNIISSVYALYLIVYFFGGTLNAEGIDAVAGGVATALVTPHMIMFLIGAIFGWVGFFAKKAWGALVAAILYSAGTLFFLLYAMFGVPILILGFVGYIMQKKLNIKNM